MKYEPIHDLPEWPDGAIAYHTLFYDDQCRFDPAEERWKLRIDEINAEISRRRMATDPATLRRMAEAWKEELDAEQ